ncbi:class I SAM-dependent methyltransferase [Candidatus Woesearchaeota archaeon]|nr:class I SAM-dependent methyltransferase [Candidatus Woesearchaeota archaeon]
MPETNPDTNAFGLQKYKPSDIFSDKTLVDTLDTLFEDWLTFLGVDKGLRPEVKEETMRSLQEHSAQTGLIDEGLRQKYREWGIIEKIGDKMQGRATAIYTLIADSVRGETLDYGCGTGEIGQMVHEMKGVPVTLTDIIDVQKRKEVCPDLPFTLREAGKTTTYRDDQFENALLITVLHHADNPLFELDEVARVTRGNIMIVETIYGVDAEDSPAEAVAQFPELYSRFHAMSHEQQRKYGTFLDWFLNKMIIGNEVNCPYNFNTPQRWEQEFAARGLEVVEKKFLGIDQPVTPEYHILYVVRKAHLESR